MSQAPFLYLSVWIGVPDDGDREIWNISEGNGTLKIQQFSIRISTDFNITIKGAKNNKTHSHIYIYQIIYKRSPCSSSDGSVIVIHWVSRTSQTTEMKSLTGQDYNIPYILSDDKRGDLFKSNMAVIIAIPVAVAVTTAAVVVVLVVLRQRGNVHNRCIQGDKTPGTNISPHAKYCVSGQDIMPGDDSTALSCVAAGNTVVDTYNRIEFKSTANKSDITCQEYNYLGEHKDDRRKDANGYEDVSLPIDDSTIH